MEISERLRERFCKDCRLPIKIFKEPYFSDRLELFDGYFNSVYKWEIFKRELNKYENEQEFFADYNRIKDAIIPAIKFSKGFKKFEKEDMNQFTIKHQGLPKKDIFHKDNCDKVFLSIDMIQANFNSLRHYDPSIFNGKNTWESYIVEYTDNAHFIESRYIRQVIFGACNPNRQVTYEKYLMDQVLDSMSDLSPMNIVYFSNDEIIIDVSNWNMNSIDSVVNIINMYSENNVPLRIEVFKLCKIDGCNGYVKLF